METSKAGGLRLPKACLRDGQRSTFRSMSLRRHIQARSGAMLVVLTGLILAWGEARAFIVEPLEGGVVAVTMSLSGESEQAATSEAALQAVNACVGRVFWGEDLFIAEDLLTACHVRK